VVGVARDVTEHRQLQDQFLQSQKMEAIGQLAGGVAHDFNNILTVIIVQCELAATLDQSPGKLRQDLQQIREAAERAAHLTRQLLLFSRQQVMQPRVLDLNETVTHLTKMLQRIIGEDVRLQLSLHSTPLTTRADPGMLDQVLMNLAVNARDAMPEGGRLLIETAATTIDETAARRHPDAAAGRYVCLAVSDTGSGISPEILPRIFEPFFTTKETGKGTGLGLATIYGIVQQHRGWIEVQSQRGQGTRFELFLPASEAPAVDSGNLEQPKPRGGKETILFVEDETPVRLITRALLEQFGYRVLPAANGVEALKVWEQHRDSIALLLTDMVMPAGISGQQLARRLEEDRPSLRVLFTSGYSAEIAGRNLELRAGENFLQKPFPSALLLETVRRTLDA
jgi:nitrogen-specific signal transduction histidine kinase